ncbi:MAG: trimethylamine methyltransferase family protein [Candidatus Acetothermia bacterium]
MKYAGLSGGKYRVLTEEEVEIIHRQAIRILTEVGVKVDSDELLAVLNDHGARVERPENVVKLDEDTITKYLDSAPSSITLHGRKEEYDLDLSDRKVFMGTGGQAIKILDPDTGESRKPKLEDQARLARLVDGLENVHFFQAPVVPTDVPEEYLTVNSFYASLAGTRKNVQEAATSVDKVDRVIEMASIIAGGREKLMERPFISFVTSWMISPLKIDIETTKILKKVTEYGIPVALSSAPVTGSTAPATLAGLLAQVHAEEIFGIVMSQMFSEGAPVLYGPVPAAANMRNMAYLAGAPETGMMNVATVQLADHIGVPIYSDAGETEAKIPDAQAGLEGAFNILQVALAGGNYIHHAAGMLESMLAVGYEKFVIDNDIIGMALRALRGIEVNEDTLAFDVVKNVGPGDNFLTQRHTIKYSRSDEFYSPHVLDRNSRDEWQEKGERDTRSRALERAQEILRESQGNLIGDEADKKIRKEFNILLPRS